MSALEYRGIRSRFQPPSLPFLACFGRLTAPGGPPASFPMGLTTVTDDRLRHLVHAHPRTLAMFTASGCAHCDHLRPVVEILATNAAYANIAFVELEADQNPVAKHLLAQNGGPFFITYCHGRLVHCDTLYTESQVRALLHALLAHA